MSRAFRFLVGARDALYRNGILQIHRLHHPVISVGNITVGGTGKTPLVILLAERFRDEGYRPVVLSRGYKRKSAGVSVNDAASPIASASPITGPAQRILTNSANPIIARPQITVPALAESAPPTARTER